MERKKVLGIVIVAVILCAAVSVWAGLGNVAERRVPTAPRATTPSPYPHAWEAKR